MSLLFVSGTGTGVGKTVVACALARRLRGERIKIGVSKPVATGARRNAAGRLISSDAIRLMRAAARPLAEYGDVNPAVYEPPISPHLAARLARRPIRLDELRRHLQKMERRFEILVVEGIGGVATPLTARETWADFMSRTRSARTLLVSSPNLGTLNHTLLSLEYLSARGVRCVCVVLSKYDPSVRMHRQNRAELERLTGLPVGVCGKDRKISRDVLDLCR